MFANIRSPPSVLCARFSRPPIFARPIRRLPHDQNPSRAERLCLEAEAWAKLDNRDQAQGRMKAALGLEPHRSAWRIELIEWLLGWGKIEEAHDLALIGLHFTPDDPEARKAQQRTAEALARGPTAPSPGLEAPRPSGN